MWRVDVLYTKQTWNEKISLFISLHVIESLSSNVLFFSLNIFLFRKHYMISPIKKMSRASFLVRKIVVMLIRLQWNGKRCHLLANPLMLRYRFRALQLKINLQFLRATWWFLAQTGFFWQNANLKFSRSIAIDYEIDIKTHLFIFPLVISWYLDKFYDIRIS